MATKATTAPGRRGSFNPFLADDAHDHDEEAGNLFAARTRVKKQVHNPFQDDSETEAEGNTVDARTKELVAEVQELNGQLAELRDAKEQMQAQIDQLQADKNEATSKLKAAQEERDELLAQAAVASEGSSSGDKEREKLQDELQATKSQLEQAKEAIEILKKAQHESHADLRIKELELQSAKFEKLAKANKKGKLKAEEQVEALTQEVERLKQDLAAASTSAASAPAPSADSDAQDALASLQESYEMLQEDHEALQIKCTALEAQLAEQTANPASDNGDEDIRRLQDELADQQAKHTQETEALQAQLKAALNRAAELELHEKVEAAEHRAAAPAPPKAKAKAESKLTKEEPKKQAQKEAPEESSKDEPKKISKGEVTEDNGASTSKPGLFTRLRATARKPPAKPVEKPEEEVNPIAFARASLRRRQPRESAQSAQPAVVEEQEDEARNLKPSDMIRRQQGEASPSPQAAPGSPGVQRKQQVTFSTPPPERKTASPPPELAEDADAEPKIVKSAEAPESSLRPKASGLRRNRPMSMMVKPTTPKSSLSSNHEIGENVKPSDFLKRFQMPGESSTDEDPNTAASVGIRDRSASTPTRKTGWKPPQRQICAVCDKAVYAMEKLEADGKIYHKNCFRCSVCNKAVSLGGFAALAGALYCKPHFKQLFKSKGNYDEGFGREQHKTKWIQRDPSGIEDSEA